ncbi:uncharacterized protein METZ01_LOCUS13834 [marine metagenome]|uniref:Uncharacterized protein n=1 Tax=marine metagenome TaxID=408172 RepID=A0A381P290_9ZZZZ
MKLNQSSLIVEKQQYLGIICAQGPAALAGLRRGHLAEDTEHTAAF